MKKIVAFITTFLLVTLPMAAANAVPAGGWNGNGPQTLLGQDEFRGCQFLYNGEFASLNGALGTQQGALEYFNFSNGVLTFKDAYYNQGGVLIPDGYLYAYLTALASESGGTLNPTYEAGANALCAPLTSVPGNPNNYVNFSMSYSFKGQPDYGTPSYRDACAGSITLDIDSWIAARVNINDLDVNLSAWFGYPISYTPGAGTSADIYVHVGTLPSGTEGETADSLTTPNADNRIIHSDTTIDSRTTTDFQVVLFHEMGLALGAGEPEASGTSEIMQTYVGSSTYMQAGDWTSGKVNGVGYSPC